MKISSKFLSIPLSIMFLQLTACDPNRVYEKNVEIPDYRWLAEEPVTFEVEITDTAQLYNIYVNVRHNFYYQFSNIWFIVHTQFPNGEKYQKRIQFELADKEGKWHSDCSGDICDYRGLIQSKAFFNEPGLYKFSIEQNMRVSPLPNVMAAGLRIEKTGETRKTIEPTLQLDTTNKPAIDTTISETPSE